MREPNFSDQVVGSAVVAAVELVGVMGDFDEACEDIGIVAAEILLDVLDSGIVSSKRGGGGSGALLVGVNGSTAPGMPAELNAAEFIADEFVPSAEFDEVGAGGMTLADLPVLTGAACTFGKRNKTGGDETLSPAENACWRLSRGSVTRLFPAAAITVVLDPV